MRELEVEEFLEIVWGERDGWIDLPAKVGEYWVPWYYRWEGEASPVVTRRVDSCLRDAESLYFSVAMFSEKGRSIEHVLGSDWLWADLDEVPPTAGRDDGLLPTVAWESSPGRFQALWKLDRILPPRVLARINQALTYHLGADPGGWDLTQVLRIPGTINFKYPSSPPVKLLWIDLDEDRDGTPKLAGGVGRDPRAIWKIVRASLPDTARAAESTDSRVASTTPRVGIPFQVRKLLRMPPTDVAAVDRSAHLWNIECLLAEAGWVEEEIFGLLVDTPWNKWAGRGDRLMRDIRRALVSVSRRTVGRSYQGGTRTSSEADLGADTTTAGAGSETEAGRFWLPFTAYGSFMAMKIEAPRWLIQDIWTAGSHGIFGGEPKTSKTTLSLALALAVASGRPFLGVYEVHTPGAVLLVQEENSTVDMQDKLRKLAWSAGLLGDVVATPLGRGALGKKEVTITFPTDIPLRLLNNYGFNLTDDAHQEALWNEVARVRPALVVLDPLYLLLPGVDINRSNEITPYLKWLLRMRNEFGCAIMVIHHQHKASMETAVRRAGQRLLGSALFHGWADSALYTTPRDLRESRPGWIGTHLEREFRTMAPQKDIVIDLRLGKPGDIERFKAEVAEYSLSTEISEVLTDNPDITAAKLAKDLGIDRKVVIGRARDEGWEPIVGKVFGRETITFQRNGSR